LINRFLKIENPKIAKDESSEENENIDKAIRKSAKDDFKVVTETMAKIYLKQGNKEKAMQIYQQLMTSNPKKSIYFANQIEKIKNS
ncbi:MAG: tetratricopeptide repeat protein, partial [Synergistales bacterium]|nr:tetratricopeptide repeat protein [Synergistales bacterium]